MRSRSLPVTMLLAGAAAFVALFVVALFVALTSAAQAAQPNEAITEFPKDFELYPRDVSTNLASVAVSGVAGADAARVELIVERDGQVFETLSRDLGPDRSYAFTISIEAELVNYTFTLEAVNDAAVRTTLREADNVVAGDVVAINGQSNARSTAFQPSTEDDTNEFIRTFGGWGIDSWVADTSWRIARRDCIHSLGCIGQWGLRFGNSLVLAEEVPVAVINGARGGSPIGYYQRNDANTDDLTTNYGRLLTRLTQARIADHVRAMLWYQGESDRTDYVGHITGFGSLVDDWLADYPSLEHVFVAQIRNNCSGDGAEISNAQRLFAAERDNVTAVSTTALNAHDGCHYGYEGGYRDLGDNIARIVRGQLYDPTLDNADAAEIRYAYVSSPTTIDIGFTPGNALVGDDGFHSLFRVQNSGTNLTVSAGSVMANGQVRLTLAQPIPNNPSITIDYTSPSGQQSWLTNSAGIGILTFLQFAPSRLGPPGDVNCDLVTDEADAKAILEYNVGSRSRSDECPLPPGAGLANVDGGDIDNDAQTGLLDALIIAQCAAGVENRYCT